MMDSWIDLLEEPVSKLAVPEERHNERICTFCDEMTVVVVRFGKYSVHMCGKHSQ